MYVHKQTPNLNSGACREKLCALITNVVHYVMVSYTRKKYVRELLLVECDHKRRRCHSYNCRTAFTQQILSIPSNCDYWLDSTIKHRPS